MARSAPDTHKVSYVPILIGVVSLALLLAAYFYLSSSRSLHESESQASAEAKAYVKNLELSDVRMQAAENFMQQQVVEVEGKITNKGGRALNTIDVYCLFYSVDGRMVHRERVAIVRAKTKPLKPEETRGFRLPFDSLPSEWNRVMPNLVVAQIAFAE